MKALVKAKPQEGIWMEEVEAPKIGPDDVLIRIKKTAICGTDIHIYNWDDWAAKNVPTPMVVGHEYAGEIVEVNSTLTDDPGKVNEDPTGAAWFFKIKPSDLSPMDDYMDDYEESSTNW